MFISVVSCIWCSATELNTAGDGVINLKT